MLFVKLYQQKMKMIKIQIEVKDLMANHSESVSDSIFTCGINISLMLIIVSILQLK